MPGLNSKEKGSWIAREHRECPFPKPEKVLISPNYQIKNFITLQEVSAKSWFSCVFSIKSSKVYRKFQNSIILLGKWKEFLNIYAYLQVWSKLDSWKNKITVSLNRIKWLKFINLFCFIIKYKFQVMKICKQYLLFA